MTLTELLDCSAEDLERLTDSELETKLSPFFTVTRPERAATTREKSKPSLGKTPFPGRDMNKLAGLAAKHGFGDLFKEVFE